MIAASLVLVANFSGMKVASTTAAIHGLTLEEAVRSSRPLLNPSGRMRETFCTIEDYLVHPWPYIGGSCAIAPIAAQPSAAACEKLFAPWKATAAIHGLALEEAVRSSLVAVSV